MCLSLNILEDQDMHVWTTLQMIENGWYSNFFFGCRLFEFYAKCGNKQTWQANYPLFLDQKHIFGWGNITLLWLFSAFILKVKWIVWFYYVHMRKNVLERNMGWILVFHWIFFFIFLFVFSWSFSIVFSSYCIFILYLFNVVIFFEYSKLAILNSDVVFRFDFLPHINVWNRTFLLPWRCWMCVLV